MLEPERGQFIEDIKHRLRLAVFSPADETTLQQIFHTTDHSKITEQLMEKQLGELNFSFGQEPLIELNGFMISESVYYAIIFSDSLSASQRVALTLHSLGHVAHSHIHRPKLNIMYEVRDRRKLSLDSLRQDLVATNWAQQTLRELISTKQPTNHLVHRALRAPLWEIRKQLLTDNLLQITHYLHLTHFRLPG